MLSLSDAVRYYLYPSPADMRSGIDSLSGIVRNQMGRNPLGGDVFIFLGKRRTQLRLLHFEGDGYSLYIKRLEKGTFELPAPGATGASVTVKAEELYLILKGVKLASVQRQKRFSFP